MRAILIETRFAGLEVSRGGREHKWTLPRPACKLGTPSPVTQKCDSPRFHCCFWPSLPDRFRRTKPATGSSAPTFCESCSKTARLCGLESPIRAPNCPPRGWRWISKPPPRGCRSNAFRTANGGGCWNPSGPMQTGRIRCPSCRGQGWLSNASSGHATWRFRSSGRISNFARTIGAKRAGTTKTRNEGGDS